MDWGLLLQIVLEAVLTIALPILLKWLFDWLQQKQRELELAMSEQQWALLHSAVEYAVRAAEQCGLREALVNAGATKKRWAIDMAEKYLAAHGFGGFDIDVIANLIEAEVNRIFNDKPVTLPIESPEAD